ncbi:KxYKxGKxW signal peptide domain-containing protein, partial [Schleiferilactobacillus harbinensis]|uniref:KxYKxGKxW signal peptide domain-containing protein n=1 Tax=Schleiferilactobacillus harbinensis TaxID=304207 RepID=UPI00164A066E
MEKLHYKMYKDGKRWVFAAITVVTLGIGLGEGTYTVKADSNNAITNTANTDAKTADNNSATNTDSTNESAVKADATSASSASDTKSAASSTAETAASSAGDTKSAAPSTATTAASSASDTKSAVSSTAATAASSSSDTKNPASSTDTTRQAVQVSYKDIINKLDAATGTASTEVTKDNFLQYFDLNGSATYDQSTGIVTLTPDDNNQVGNFALKSKIDTNTQINFLLN